MFGKWQCLCAVPLCVTLTPPVDAMQVTENLNVGGAIRGRMDYDPDQHIREFSFDALALSVDYKSDTWVGAARYWLYGGDYPYDYVNSVGDISFPEYAWVGYNLNPETQVQFGLNQVPFGILPYFSSTFTETLGYVIGLEDLYEVGGKYQKTAGDWNVQAGYYLRPSFQGKGTSQGGRTYSNVIARADEGIENGSHNQERNLVAVRIAKSFSSTLGVHEVGVSALTSTLENSETHDNGRRSALALHYTQTTGPWVLQLLAARQIMSPRNQGSDDVVTLGGLDATYNVASRGNLYVTGVDYNVSETFLDGEINTIKLYGNYSAFLKSGKGYYDTQRYIAGVSFYIGSHLFIATEWLFGKSDPYVGGSDYVQSLAAGGSRRWENQGYMNIGFYF
ncbi:porin [Pseudomonas putida]|uniref:porin n=1 Tax=Pseudomonas putida TaxID=303 RepID=UPI00383B37AD